MTTSQPQFQVGDRCFSHYMMDWGTIESIGRTDRDQTHGVTDEPLPDTTWYAVRMDRGSTEWLDDAHGNWDLARILPPAIAQRYGYGEDPRAASAADPEPQADCGEGATQLSGDPADPLGNVVSEDGWSRDYRPLAADPVAQLSNDPAEALGQVMQMRQEGALFAELEPPAYVLMLYPLHPNGTTGEMVEDPAVARQIGELVGLGAPTDPGGWGIWEVHPDQTPPIGPGTPQES